MILVSPCRSIVCKELLMALHVQLLDCKIVFAGPKADNSVEIYIAKSTSGYYACIGWGETQYLLWLFRRLEDHKS